MATTNYYSPETAVFQTLESTFDNTVYSQVQTTETSNGGLWFVTRREWYDGEKYMDALFICSIEEQELTEGSKEMTNPNDPIKIDMEDYTRIMDELTKVIDQIAEEYDILESDKAKIQYLLDEFDVVNYQ